ncbi:MAG: iron-containing alcohol dehydrogenase [Ignisphaera sp.]|uniref:Iron-containing alcohol dehydrogenase n=1 Tax=Ignisphaera aggregans TaxID=334771 RepID=A0A7J3MXP5_9CREN
MELKNFRLRYAETTLYFGLDAVQNIKDYLSKFERAVIVSGRASAKLSGALNDIENILRDLGIKYTVYDNVSPNPWANQAEDLAKTIWFEGAEAVIAIGGGSPIDTAKIGLTIAVNGGKVKDYIDGVKKVKRSLPLIAINTTHGTGTEVDRYAVITLDDVKEKHGLSIKYPNVSVDDPKYTLTLDRRQTLYTSLDAFYHVYESATSLASNIFIEMLSEEAVKVISEVLPQLVNDLKNIELRYKMMYAAMIAGIAIDMGSTHIIHGIEHTLSGLEPKLAHACGLALLGPRAVYYTHRVRPEQSAKLLRHINPSIKPSPEYAEEASRAVFKFQEEVGFKERLGDYSFTEKELKIIAELALARLNYMFSNTPFVVTEDIMIDIVRSAL